MGLLCSLQHPVDPCSFATIPNALKQCAVFANNHSFSSLQRFEFKTSRHLIYLEIKYFCFSGKVDQMGSAIQDHIRKKA